MIMNEKKTWKSLSRDIECNATMTVTFIEESDRQQIKYFKLVILCLFYWLIIFHSMKVTAEVLTVSLLLNSEWQNALSTSMGPRATLRIMTCSASCLSTSVTTKYKLTHVANYVTVNEKIYIFIWFWFLALSLLSFAVVLYRFIIIFSPYIRAYVLRMRFRLVRDNQCWPPDHLIFIEG